MAIEDSSTVANTPWHTISLPSFVINPSVILDLGRCTRTVSEASG